MHRVIILFALVCVFSGIESNAQSAESEKRPNILFIMTDQQRWDCIGANGNNIIQTPHIDALAKKSANFTHFFVNSPVCVPSRASFFTGRYPHAHKNRVNYTLLSETERLLPSYLQEAGYTTALVGKTHLYYNFPPTPTEAQRTGFDIVELHDGVSKTDKHSAYAKWYKENDPKPQTYYRATAQSQLKKGEQLPKGMNPYRALIKAQYSDTAWTGLKTREYIEQFKNTDEPFFIFTSFWKPHSPFEVHEPYDSMYSDIDIPLPKAETLESIQLLPPPLQELILRGRPPVYSMDRDNLQWIYRSYYGTVTHIDDEVGHILKTLEKTGQAENTIVIFTSDHGDQLLEHGMMGKNAFFESSIRVPFMLHYPGKTQSGQYNELIESVDLLPTLFEWLNLPEPHHNQGQSLAPLISNTKREYQPRDAVFAENIIPEVITTGYLDFDFTKGKGIKNTRHPDAKMVRTRRWKYNHYPDGYAELYDLQSDPNEEHNLAGNPKYRATEHELQLKLLNWLITTTETEQIAPKWLKP